MPPRPKPYILRGFRSARFGMTERQVRRAIIADFGVEPSDIGTIESKQERTKSLVVVLQDLVPNAGPAAVAYILGYRSRTLIQVNVQWGGPLVETRDDKVLRRVAAALQKYLLERGYRQDTVVVNRAQPNGAAITVFAGRDPLGRMTTLILANPTRPGADAEAAGERPRPTLTLSYRLDPDSPDVFQIQKGRF